MHFFGVFMQVHFEAKRYGLRGLTPDEMPRLKESLRQRWPTLVPLALLIGILVSGHTPYLAAFTGITSCAIVGLTTRVSGNLSKNWGMFVLLHAVLGLIAFADLGQHTDTIKLALFALGIALLLAGWKLAGITGRIDYPAMVESFETGAKYALAVGAAAGTVGIVIGAVTLTGVGFKISYIITAWATTIAGGVSSVLPAFMVDMKTLTLLAALAMTAIVCILMGCGVPTTATYIIMVTVAAPTLVQLGVQPLVAHFFVFYYGVLADITPPVALAAYAAAGMAGSDPFKTGNTAFRLGMAKALVPFVFVFSPSLLVVAKGFTMYDFVVTFVGCVLGIVVLAAALSRFFLVEMKRWEQLLCLAAAILLIAPGLVVTIVGIVVAAPVFLRQLAAWKLANAAPAPA
jgi:TRAP transporter 4TM/12TM fusion protein